MFLDPTKLNLCFHADNSNSLHGIILSTTFTFSKAFPKPGSGLSRSEIFIRYIADNLLLQPRLAQLYLEKASDEDKACGLAPAHP